MYNYLFLFFLGFLFCKFLPLLEALIECLTNFINIATQFATCNILKLHASTADLEHNCDKKSEQIGFFIDEPIEEEEDENENRITK